MKKTIILFLCLLGFNKFVLSGDCEPEIKFDILVGTIWASKSPSINNNVSITTQQSAKIIFLDTCGTALIEVYEDSILSVSGKYVADNKLYTSEGQAQDPLNLDLWYMVKKCHYKPLRDSLWNYYAKDGKIVRSEMYDKGRMIGVNAFGAWDSKW